MQGVDASSTNGATGVVGNATGSSGYIYGVVGQTYNSVAGTGVFGLAGDTGNYGSGVAGTDIGAANTGYGGYFTNTATSGVNYGAYATTATTSAGYGVYGTITGHGNTGYAGYFKNTDTGADVNYGVYGTTASSSGYGGYFSNSSTGWALNATGTSYFNGNVGIGTAAPISTLTVNGTITQTPALSSTTSTYLQTNASGLYSTTSLWGGVLVLSASGNDTGVDAGYSSVSGRYRGRFFTHNAADLAFSTHAAGVTPTSQSSFTDLMVIRGDSGYVGIGTTSPGALLDIGLAGTTTGTLRLEGGTSGYVQSCKQRRQPETRPFSSQAATAPAALCSRPTAPASPRGFPTPAQRARRSRALRLAPPARSTVPIRPRPGTGTASRHKPR